jgi:multicomponent Na+:H+ antiporter subunit A
VLLHLAVIAPLIFAVLVPILYRYVPKIHIGWFVSILPISIFIYLASFLPEVSGGETIYRSISWIPSLGIDFSLYIDGLGLLFGLLISGIGFLVTLYSVYYLSKEEKLNNFYVYLLMFMTAMLGIVLSDNLIVMYAFWELTSLSSFLLIGFWYHRSKSVYGAQKSMLITVFGGFAMLAGIVLLYLVTGTFSIREIISKADLVLESALFLPILLLMLLGAFSKSAQFPFHIWLPDAMEAPTPVSAYLHSATMVKAGIYLVARLSPIFAVSNEWFIIVSGIGLITLFWCSFLAIRQTDLKGILAFSTVSQLGLIMSLLGFGTPIAVTAAVFHLFNHAAFKGALFMVVGIVDHETGARDIRKLGGLMAFMPITATMGLIGAFSMAGIPPFNGFLSKEMFLAASLEASTFANYAILFPILAVIASVFTFAYSMMLFFKVFRGPKKTEQLDRIPHEAPKGMLISPLVLTAIVIVIGIFPNLISSSIIAPTVEAITLQPQENIHIKHWHGFDPTFFMTMIVFLLGTLIYLGLTKWHKVYDYLPNRLSANEFYDKGLIGLEKGSAWITRVQMTGLLRNYLVIIFSFLVVLLSYTLFSAEGFRFDTSNLANVEFYEVILALVVIIAAVSSLFFSSRLATIIVIGVVGYGVALFFVIFRAPDLALTQLIVETVTVALFLLCFVHLPGLGKERTLPKFKLQNAILSAGVGLIFMLIAVSAHSTRLFESIAPYYVENSYQLAGGRNVVNVILVDFRGLDTMLEILVLGIAALGIYAIIRLSRIQKEEDV